MTLYYVYSGAAGTGTGADWTNAFTTLAAAFSAEAAGDTIYVAHDHAQSTASNISHTSSGTQTNPTKILCVNRAGTVPPVAADLRTTATVTTTGASYQFFDGFAYCYGIIFNIGTGGGTCSASICTSDGEYWRMDSCSVRLVNSSSSSRIFIGSETGNVDGSYVEWNNVTVSFGHASQSFSLKNGFKWRNTASALLGTMPTTLFNAFSMGFADIQGCDFSAMTSGTILGAVLSAGSADGYTFRMMDCKLDAGVTKISGNPATPGVGQVYINRCSATGNYQILTATGSGNLNEETTIVRTGGASDGTTPIAWKIVTNTTGTFIMPFETPPIAIWNDTTGSSVTASIEGIWGGGAVPNDDEIWIEVEYLSDATAPLASFTNDGKATILTTAAGQTSSSETWGGSTTKFKLAVSFTPQQKGWIYARVKCGKISTTFYVDPLVTLS